MKKLWYTPDLQLFAGEGTEAVNGESGGENAVAGQSGAEIVSTDDEFNQLISGKFKEQFTKKTQAIIDKRFKQTKELEEYKERVSPLVESLLKKYGVESGNENTLIDFIEKPIEQTERVTKAQRVSTLRGRISDWIKQSDEVKNTYPDFDLRNELRGSKLFSQLLLGGAPLKAAYETVHKDEILSGAMAYTADRVREQVVKGIEAKGRRPLENGVSSESAVVTSVDVNSLTSQDILKILKQVENGASISF
ncbi:MAG: hypothetical protein IKT55_03085 [Clostridia bacterium]|nr:hypothetical protein [Clostridia bacterium]